MVLVRLWCAKREGTIWLVVRRRRLRKLVPDAELVRRRAAGETFRELAPDYGVVHSTLVRYFERPEVAKQVRQAARQLRAESRALEGRRRIERRLAQDVRRNAKEQIAREREQARRAPAPGRQQRSRRPSAGGSYIAWLDERDARVPLTRADRWSRNDRVASDAVEAGGGMQAVIDATGLNTSENVARLIDPAIVKHALDNDILNGTKPPL